VSSVHSAAVAPVRPAGTVQKASTYVPVQPTPAVGAEREPRTFGPMFGTPATLTTTDLLAVRPRTRFSVDGRGTIASGTRAPQPTGTRP
jgi:hypothetical protein